jgi:glycosyltransferase involved in cell wall biosynthesis
MNEIIVSICCLTCNHKTLIGDALDGFLMQKTDFPFEIIIHDDASTDGTADIIREYTAEEDGNYGIPIRSIFQTENYFSKTGIYPFVKVFAAARGKYIADCDGDDYWTDPLKLQKQVDFLEANPGYSMCYHDYLINQVDRNIMEPPVCEPPHDYSALELLGYNRTGHLHPCTRMWRNVFKEVMAGPGGEWAGWDDYSVNVMMGMYGACKYLPDIKPSVFRRGYGGNSWTNLPGVVMGQKTAAMHKQIFDLVAARGNPEQIKIREQFLGRTT